jgi:hypothetical protein
MSDVRTVYAKARAETAKLLGYDDDLEQLTAEQSTRLDVACALRIALDDQAAKLLRGESTDVAKLLSASEALSRILPPAVLASPPPATNSPDPRQIMWETYVGMRRRGELFDPCSTYEGMKAEVERLRARVAELEGNRSTETTDCVSAHTKSSPPAPAAPAPAGNNVVKLPPRTVDVNALPSAEPEPWRRFSHLYE